ncbi:MAG: aldose epimerase family protein [Phycisphaerae bacterium]|jgi:aldose 1-epimerase
MSIRKEPFGGIDGKEVSLYTLANSRGTVMKVTNYGGIVTSLRVADRAGKIDDVTLGFDRLEGYLQRPSPYLGALIGRYGNRIAHGKFTLGGKTYTVPLNNGNCSLHGGLKGFDQVVWSARPLQWPEGDALELTYLSVDGEEGYPGNLKVTVVYLLSEDDQWRIDYTAATDKETVVNLTQHAYFNLAGEGCPSVAGTEMMINAGAVTPMNSDLVPTGEIRPVAGTPFDFTSAKPIGQRIDAQDEQLVIAKGYDINYVLNKKGGELSLAARACEPTTGRVMEVLTTEPGVQLYTGNFLDGKLVGKSGRAYGKRSGFCLETQHFPDSVNHPEFPSTTLRPGEKFSSTTIYKFSTK